MAATELNGQLTGSVGSYNAMRLVWPRDASVLEAAMLARLRLPSPNSRVCSQIAPPEPMTDLVYYALSCMSIIANIADDMRHLHRSDISEVRGAGDDGRIGSSTMPHKSNPIDFENVKSLWKAVSPRIVTLLLDQVSEHQRDLTNSASTRFTAEIFAIVAYAARRMSIAMRELTIDAVRMQQNLSVAADDFVSEPLYIGLALAGATDAHADARRIVQNARADGVDILEAMRRSSGRNAQLGALQPSVQAVMANPASYTGMASEIALRTALASRSRLAKITNALPL